MSVERHLTRAHRIVGDTGADAGRGAFQMGWYDFAAVRLAPGKTVLDVGCGTAMGLAALQRTAARAVGQDIDPRLARDDVMITSLEQIPDKSYDLVTAIDVVEHVEDDAGFMRALRRIARERIFVTTPLWYRGREIWPYHIREYRHGEFMALMRLAGSVTYIKGSPRGEEIYPVNYLPCFRAMDWLRNAPLLNLGFRVGQKALPRPMRYLAHQAAIIAV